MRTVSLREAKSKFSELVDAVQKGERVTVTRHGEPAVVWVLPEEAKMIKRSRKSVADVLLSFPGDDLDLERDNTPVPDVDL